MKRTYPYKVQVTKYDTVLVKYSGVRLWSKWNARIDVRAQGRKNPQLIPMVFIQKSGTPRGEVRLRLCEVKFLMEKS